MNLPFAFGIVGPGTLFRRGTEDRRRDQKRRVRFAFADRVDEAVQRRCERALSQRIHVHDVDADLQAQHVGAFVAHRARHELIEMAVAAEAEVQQFDVREARRNDGPRSGGARRFHAMADRTAVMHPTAPRGRARRFDLRAVFDAQTAQLENGVGRQPQFAVFESCRQIGERDRARFAANTRRLAAIGEIDLQLSPHSVATLLTSFPSMTRSNTAGSRRFRDFDARRQHVEFDACATSLRIRAARPTASSP